MGSFPDCRIKLCDFGLMRSVDSSSVVREIIGTPDYVGEEMSFADFTFTIMCVHYASCLKITKPFTFFKQYTCIFVD